jgi:4'-phosphopantetheinyl transferase
MLDTHDTLRICSWSLDIDNVAAERLMPLLSADEQARANRLVRRQDALRFVAARAGLRQILGEVTGVPASAVKIAYSQSGKPRLHDSGGLHFNLSHSNGLAVLALGWQGPLGIDVERVRMLSPGIEEQFLTATEIASLRQFGPDARAMALMKCWAAKEAVIKFHGDVRQVSPMDIELMLDMQGATPVVRVTPLAGCSLVPISAEAGYVCMLASGKPARMQDIVFTAWRGLAL